MAQKGLPAEAWRSAAVLETMEDDSEKVRNIPLPVRRQELTWDHINKLGQEEARELLGRVLEAKKELKVLPWRLRASPEAGILRGIVAMAENDLREVLHIQADPMSQGFPRKKRIKRSERAQGRRGRGGCEDMGPH